MASISKLVDGYRVFKNTTYQEHKDLITHLIRQKQKASTLVVTSSSLRIAPETIFGCNPGDLYVVRNVAGFVPPYKEGEGSGTIAAIEYAIKTLCVENVVILGHAHCDGIELLMAEDDNAIRERQEALSQEGKIKEYDPMKCWLTIGKEARDAVKKDLGHLSAEEQESACEQEAILVSMKNLIGYPWVEQLLAEDKISVHGWHFNIETGELYGFDSDTRFFELIE